MRTSDKECIHLLLPGTCATCNSPRKPGAGIEGPPTRTITARFDSLCAWCADPIYEGDALGRFDGEWIHLSHFEEL